MKPVENVSTKAREFSFAVGGARPPVALTLMQFKLFFSRAFLLPAVSSFLFSAHFQRTVSPFFFAAAADVLSSFLRLSSTERRRRLHLGLGASTL